MFNLLPTGRRDNISY